MALQSNQDWQTTKKTVLERSCHMFNNPLMSDVAFTCGESKRKSFYAHKYVLATSSSVFYAMFYGDLAEKNSVIHLCDTDEESLEEFLRFLYTDQCTEAPEIAVKVLYLAKKYMIPSMAQKCIKVAKSNIKTENVVTVLEQAMQFHEKGLKEKCWEVVDFQTSKTVTSEAFRDIKQKTLISLLKRNTLNISEIELFQAVLKWSDYQCSKNGLETTGENRRAVIGDAIYNIRFLSMTMKEFAQCVSSSGLLTDGEVIPIYEKFCGLENPKLKWKQPKRESPINLQQFARFHCDDLKHLGSSWSYGSNPDRLSFIVNKPATFHGVRLFGDVKCSEYEVSLEVKGENVSGTYIPKLDDENISGYNVILPTPINVDPNKVVTMVAFIKGPPSYYGNKGRTSVYVDGATVTFSKASGISNGTDVQSGQFYKIILST